jgi:hypothetical protein
MYVFTAVSSEFSTQHHSKIVTSISGENGAPDLLWAIVLVLNILFMTVYQQTPCFRKRKKMHECLIHNKSVMFGGRVYIFPFENKCVHLFCLLI